MRAAAALGIPALYRRITGRRHLILLFHRVRPEGVPQDPFDTCPSHAVEVFRAVLEYVANAFLVVGLRELVARRNERRPLAAITFDDGWRDTYAVAFPLLKQLGLPATVFLTSAKIGAAQPFWQQILGAVFRRAVEEHDPTAREALRRVLDAPEDCQLTAAAYRQTVIQWKRLPAGEREKRIASLLADCPNPRAGPRCFLSVAEIKEMHAAGIEFGSHTVNHELLDACSPQRLDYELRESKAQIEAIIGEPVESIAYPDGTFTRLVVRRAQAAGYRIGCTTRALLVGPSESPLLLPRLDLDRGVVPAKDATFRRAIHGGQSSETLQSPAGEIVMRSRVGVRVPRKAQEDVCAASAQHSGSGLSNYRLLLLIDQICASHGGTEQHLLFLCQHLPRAGTPTHLALLTGIRRADAAIFPIQPQVLGQGNHGPLPLRFGARIRRLARLISREDIDIVYAFCPVSELAAVLATRLARRGRVVGCQRNTGYWHSAATLWRARLARRFVRHIVANCQAAARFAIESEWVPSDRVSVIPNPINLERLEQGERNPLSREQAGIRPGEKVVGIVANVRPVKDYDTFFQAARLVLDRHPATRFLVVGDYLPAYRERLLQTVASLGISNQVAWLGVVENPYQVLPHFDVGVLSSRSEAFSNALLEYASAGVPAVATAVGGSPELVIDGHTGFLVPPGDPAAMAARINLLLDQPELARTLGRQAKEQAFARCGQEKILAQYQALFSRLLGRESCAKKH